MVELKETLSNTNQEFQVSLLRIEILTTARSHLADKIHCVYPLEEQVELLASYGILNEAFERIILEEARYLVSQK